MRRWFVMMVAGTAVLAGVLASPAPRAFRGGGVYWDVYRDLVTNVVLLDKVTGTHLAQWNLY